MQSYSLCSDMIDVVIDMSCIYGLRDGAPPHADAYDERSSATIHLHNGRVLYLREVNKYLALACIMRRKNFKKQGIIDYNFQCVRKAVNDVFAHRLGPGKALAAAAAAAAASP